MNQSIQKKSVITALIYIAIMGLGMFIMYHIFGISYSDSNIGDVMIFVELILTSFALYANFKVFDNSGFDTLDVSNLKWFMPFGILITIMFATFCITANWQSVNMIKLILALVTCILVGISEEVIFRGIVLHSFLKITTKTKAVVVSALLFALLHSVNVLGGLAFRDMLLQLFSTFVFGVTFACICIKIKNIVPIIIYHALWDFVLIASAITGSKIGLLASIGTIMNIVLAIVYLVKIRRESLQDEKII